LDSDQCGEVDVPRRGPLSILYIGFSESPRRRVPDAEVRRFQFFTLDSIEDQSFRRSSWVLVFQFFTLDSRVLGHYAEHSSELKLSILYIGFVWIICFTLLSNSFTSLLSFNSLHWILSWRTHTTARSGRTTFQFFTLDSYHIHVVPLIKSLRANFQFFTLDSMYKRILESNSVIDDAFNSLHWILLILLHQANELHKSLSILYIGFLVNSKFRKSLHRHTFNSLHWIRRSQTNHRATLTSFFLSILYIGSTRELRSSARSLVQQPFNSLHWIPEWTHSYVATKSMK